MFFVARKDMGEFVFFMSQPAAILFEALIHAIWKRLRTRNEGFGPIYNRVTSLICYLWVFLWFSVLLPVYIKGCRDVGILQDVIFRSRVYDLVDGIMIEKR
jgi:hypothetical protein